MDIILALVSDTNPKETLTNSDLNLDALILYEDTLLEACPVATMAATRSGLDNTPTVSWSTR